MTKRRNEISPEQAVATDISVFSDLFKTKNVAELKMRADLMIALGQWLADAGLSEVQAAKALG